MATENTHTPDFIIQTLVAERDELKQHCLRLQQVLDKLAFPPGHFYSPIVDPADIHAVRAAEQRLAAPLPQDILIDRRAMTAILVRLASHHRLFTFPRSQTSPDKFHFDNPFFGAHDASVYFSMLLEFRPGRVIEIGCGFSSRLLLETNRQFFSGRLDITLIDPSPGSLSHLTNGNGEAMARLLTHQVQETPIDTFKALEANDILFIDSSHVSKTGSDVNFYLFEILPVLKPGVLVHVHDILYPFEYPIEWIRHDKRSWNEAYMLHAFLQNNHAFEIVYWNNFAYHYLTEELRRQMPLCLENEGGSLWLKKLH
jgi:hypothetical protein